MTRVPFSGLTSSDLVVDATYESDANSRSVAGEPLGPLTGTGNQGGFRFSGSIAAPEVVVLYTTMSEPDWPDSIDEENGLFFYYGDNRRPGFELHDRKAGRGGNQILRNVFALAHAGPQGRARVPPFLIFSKGELRRDVRFRGLAVPGAVHLDAGSDLIATWKSIGGERFQNYRAIFTILDVATVSRSWLDATRGNDKFGDSCPDAFRSWVESGKPKALQAERVTRTRSSDEQLGRTPQQRAVAGAVYQHFKESSVAFEHFAASIARMMDANIVSLDVTRPSRDGGRDGIGRYRIGQAQNCVTVDFALEAKCHAPTGGLGVKVLSRLISRLRHRQFGILVTTTFLSPQAYQELVEDQHPIVVCSGGDLAELLIEKQGLSSAVDTASWLRVNFPVVA
jgi:hypothetical protein